jgi:hypothetical protein
MPWFRQTFKYNYSEITQKYQIVRYAFRINWQLNLAWTLISFLLVIIVDFKINKTYMRMTTKHSYYTMDKLVIEALFE